jgi:hypothetical protein
MSRLNTFCRIALVSALALSLASPAFADSFLTSVSTGSKTAARVAPPAYTGSAANERQARGAARRAIQTIKATRNVAIGLDVLQRIDSLAMDRPEIATSFRLGLAKLARTTGDPRVQVLRAANLALRKPESRYAATMLRKAVATLPADSAAQLVAGLTIAQRDTFGFGNWDKPSRLAKEAAGYLNKATALEAKTSHPRPLVREGLKQAKDYANYYGSFNGLLK